VHTSWRGGGAESLVKASDKREGTKLKLQNRLHKSVRSAAAAAAPPHSIAFIYLPSSLCHFSAAGVRVNGISMRDYVYAAWAKQIAVPLQGKVAAFGGVRFIMPNAYVHYLFTK